MRVNDIEYALAIARHGSLAKACDVLGLSQPALSKALVRLEAELKTRLFDRQPRGMRLTEQGRMFIEHAQRLVTSASDMRASLRDVRQGYAGVVRLGIGIGVPNSLLVKPITRIAAKGQVRFEITSGHSDTLMSDLMAGHLDLIVTGIPRPDDPDLEWQPLWNDPLVPFVPKINPKSPTSWTIKSIRHERWLLPPTATPARKRFDSAFITAGLEPPDALVESRASGCSFELCLALDMIALMPSSLIHEKRVAENFNQVLCIKSLVLDRTVALVSRKLQFVTPLVANFIHLVESLATTEIERFR